MCRLALTVTPWTLTARLRIWCSTRSPNSTLGEAIGIGWFLRDMDVVRTAGHGGSANGQFAELLTVPERGSPSRWPTPGRTTSPATSAPMGQG